MLKEKKVPLRKCIGCQQMKPKKELIRIVRNKENEMFVDDTGKKQGRGAYICKDIACFNKIKKSKALERTFECNISDEIYNDLEEQLNKFKNN